MSDESEASVVGPTSNVNGKQGYEDHEKETHNRGSRDHEKHDFDDHDRGEHVDGEDPASSASCGQNGAENGCHGYGQNDNGWEKCNHGCDHDEGRLGGHDQEYDDDANLGQSSLSALGDGHEDSAKFLSSPAQDHARVSLQGL